MPSHTVHLCKSLNMESKGYIHKKCRINLWNRKYRFMLIYCKLAESWQFKQSQNTAPQALIISSNFWTATWLYNIVLWENKNNFAEKPCLSKLETWNLKLDPCISKIKSRLSTYFSGLVSVKRKSCPIARG